jgi:hypothetical protein
VSIFNASSPTGNKLRHGLRVLGAVLILTAFVVWFKAGAHTGFTKNRVEVFKVDPITQIEYTDYKESFVMGVEYLAAASLTGLGLIASGFIFARKQ